MRKKNKIFKFNKKLSVFRPLFILALFFSFPQNVNAQETYLTTSDQFKIYYDYEKVPEEKGCILLIHGWGMNSGEWSIIKNDLLRAKWSILAIDLRGHGSSINKGNEQFFYDELGAHELGVFQKDVEAAMSFLLPNHENIWIMGSSIGANLGLRHAAQDSNVSGLALFSPGLAYGNLTTQKAVRQYGKRPLLIVSSEKDYPSGADSQKLYELAIGKKELISLKKKEHGTGLLRLYPDLTGKIIEWLNSI